MKIAIVLSGSLQSIISQAEELNGYMNRNFSKVEEMEAWIVAAQEVDVKTIGFSHKITSVKLVEVRTNHVAEEYLEAITKMYEGTKPQILVFGSDWFATGLAVRTAYRLKGTSCTGVKSSQYDDGRFLVEKAVYSNHLTAKFRMKTRPFCLSIAKGFKEKTEFAAKPPAVERLAFASSLSTAWLQGYRCEQMKTPAGLSAAKIVVAVGKGIGSKEKIPLLAELTERLGGELGASRPVVMNAWLGMDRLIGASGSILSPEVCIVIGASGAAAFAVGIEKSKLIIAVNRDEKAPILKIADVAICSDYQEFVDELIKRLNAE
ncbi:electron transfer flavoprotein subunit alpha/FixB family protein [Sporomusa sp.]|uniref:electron transfer flavoprotein subunit alpha/FixB family protein n=1 Tax=Sporomusa sp. TaxID=2078658 RepID=UPI002BDB0C51|nr:electron transfer flavoprotein subunit alpha/FixB family protein [Sporomusa sp.]HWR45870.1 electron transfer flavoprotein subunit alpha/FixB family protein [Sporomusa sp.]